MIDKACLSRQAELSGDEATLQVLEAAEVQIAEDVRQELEQLAERQMEHQAALDVKQAEEMLALEDELKAEEYAGSQQVDDQIEEQKLKVGQTHRAIGIKVSYFLHPLSRTASSASPLHQSINQSINQSTNQPTNQPINQLTHPPTHPPTNQLMKINWWTNLSRR